MKPDDTIYPVISGRLITLMNDYGNLATGSLVELDFSEIENTNLADEAMNYIRYKYETRSASVTYLRVFVPAVRCFDTFATIRSVDSFQAYNDDLKKQYREYLDNLVPEGRPVYSENYKRFLVAVPRTIQRGQ